jgi:hypothetical protein
MDPPEIFYEDTHSLMLVNQNGKMRRLYTPFRVQVMEEIGKYGTQTWVYVERVAEHKDYRILFLISTNWYPYPFFKLPM